MQTIKWTFRAFLYIGLLQLVSCTKNIDIVTNDSISAETSDDLSFPVTNEFSNCKLRRIIHENGLDPNYHVSGLFTYNSAGNPISVTYGWATGTGNPNHYFFYDNKNRLKEWRIAYSANDIVEATWHKYGYNSNNQIISDTTLNPGFTSSDGTVYPGDTTVISTLSYDNQGRVIKEVVKNLRNGTTRYPTYTYDNRGNLGVLGWKSSSYDNKVSIYRSHPVFQFISRNFSRNNAAPQSKYNSRGLPLSVNNMNDPFFNAYPADPENNSAGGIYKAIYDCQ